MDAVPGSRRCARHASPGDGAGRVLTRLLLEPTPVDEGKATPHPLAAVLVGIPVTNAAAPAATARREYSARLMAVAVDPTQGRAPTLTDEQFLCCT